MMLFLLCCALTELSFRPLVVGIFWQGLVPTGEDERDPGLFVCRPCTGSGGTPTWCPKFVNSPGIICGIRCIFLQGDVAEIQVVFLGVTVAHLDDLDNEVRKKWVANSWASFLKILHIPFGPSMMEQLKNCLKTSGNHLKPIGNPPETNREPKAVGFRHKRPNWWYFQLLIIP